MASHSLFINLEIDVGALAVSILDIISINANEMRCKSKHNAWASLA